MTPSLAPLGRPGLGERRCPRRGAQLDARIARAAFRAGQPLEESLHAQSAAVLPHQHARVDHDGPAAVQAKQVHVKPVGGHAAEGADLGEQARHGGEHTPIAPAGAAKGSATTSCWLSRWPARTILTTARVARSLPIGGLEPTSASGRRTVTTAAIFASEISGASPLAGIARNKARKGTKKCGLSCRRFQVPAARRAWKPAWWRVQRHCKGDTMLDRSTRPDAAGRLSEFFTFTDRARQHWRLAEAARDRKTRLMHLLCAAHYLERAGAIELDRTSNCVPFRRKGGAS